MNDRKSIIQLIFSLEHYQQQKYVYDCLKTGKTFFWNIIIKIQIMDPGPQQKASREQKVSHPLATNLEGDTHSLGKKYNVQLTVSQANAILKILPLCYSFQIEREVKIRRNNNKKKSSNKKDTSNLIEVLDKNSERVKKSCIGEKNNEDLASTPAYNRTSSKAYYEDSEDALQPCLKIVHLLKNHKTSLPFRDPVDPIAQGVPNYFQIIKEPMDLATIQSNLKKNFYVSQTQFHADINKIISNSYLFNKNNSDFLKLTEQFETYYKKISNDVNNHRTQVPSFSTKATFTQKNKKQKSMQKCQPKFREPNQSQTVTLAEKKNLAMNLKKLPRQYLLGVATIVYDGQPPQSEQLNIENLQAPKIRQLQKYVQEKMILIQQKKQAEKQIKQENNEDHSDQSSFKSDSDS